MRRFIPALALLVLASCTSGSPAGYEMSEYSIAGPAALAPGTDSVPISNAGRFPHALVVTDEAGTVKAATGLVEPGETVHLDFDLGPGSYVFTCRIVVEIDGGVLVDHYQQGMMARVEVAA